MASDVDSGGNMSIFFHWPNPVSSSVTIERSDNTREIVQVPYFQQTFAIHDWVIEQTIACRTPSILCS
uniref:Uncharacterized protein n=1 Tax=Arundo donax TaxID=35708 RepID=A0A0A9CN18_ARUDO